MKRIATVLAAGAFALFAGSLILVETADQASAAMRGGGGGGMRSFGGGGGMRSMGGGSRTMMRSSNISARHINVSKTVSKGTTRSARVTNTRVTRVNKSGRHVNVS